MICLIHYLMTVSATFFQCLKDQLNFHAGIYYTKKNQLLKKRSRLSVRIKDSQHTEVIFCHSMMTPFPKLTKTQSLKSISDK